MANPSNYAGVPGFNIDIENAPAPSTAPLERYLNRQPRAHNLSREIF